MSQFMLSALHLSYGCILSIYNFMVWLNEYVMQHTVRSISGFSQWCWSNKNFIHYFIQSSTSCTHMCHMYHMAMQGHRPGWISNDITNYLPYINRGKALNINKYGNSNNPQIWVCLSKPFFLPPFFDATTSPICDTS